MEMKTTETSPSHRHINAAAEHLEVEGSPARNNEHEAASPPSCNDGADAARDNTDLNVSDVLVSPGGIQDLVGPCAFDSNISEEVVLSMIPSFIPLPDGDADRGVPLSRTAGSSTHSRHRDSISSARRPSGHRHPATSGSSLMPSIQSSEADRMRPASWSVPSGPSREPSPPSQFMTLVEGDGPTSEQMWAQLGADVMMEISRQRQNELSFLSFS